MDNTWNEADSISTIRRLNIEAYLGHGDLKLLADRLDKNANYLSQLFSFKSKRALSDKLARKVELALSLDRGALDRNPEEVQNTVDWKEEENRVQQDLKRVDELNKVSDLAFELLQTRLKELLPDAIFTSNISIPFDGQAYHAQFLIEDINRVPILVVETTRSKAGLTRLISQKNVLALMSITGSEYGLIATESAGQLLETWLENNEGKIELLGDRPTFQ